MKLAVISVALIMLASAPAVEARTVVQHHASATAAHATKVSDSKKSSGKKAKHHKAKKAKHTG